MGLDGVGKDFILEQNVAEIDVEGCEVVFSHRVDLLDVDVFCLSGVGGYPVRPWCCC